MQKFVVGACLLTSVSVCADKVVNPSAPPIDLTSPNKEVCGHHSLLLQNGEWLCGEFDKLPSIRYSFGIVNFDINKVVAISFSPNDKKMTVLTRDGLQFTGPMLNENLSFKEVSPGGEIRKELNPDQVKYILLDQKSDNIHFLRDKGFSLQLKNGDIFPVLLDRNPIHVSDGWQKSTIDPAKILELSFNGGFHGYMDHKGTPEEVSFSFITDKYLGVHVADTVIAVKLPWIQILSITKAERLENTSIAPSPDHKIVKKGGDRVSGTAIAIVGEEVQNSSPAEAATPPVHEDQAAPESLSHTSAWHRVHQPLFDPEEQFETLEPIAFEETKPSVSKDPIQIPQDDDHSHEQLAYEMMPPDAITPQELEDSKEASQRGSDNSNADSDIKKSSDDSKHHDTTTPAITSPKSDPATFGHAALHAAAHRVPQRLFDPEDSFETIPVAFEDNKESGKQPLEVPHETDSSHEQIAFEDIKLDVSPSKTDDTDDDDKILPSEKIKFSYRDEHKTVDEERTNSRVAESGVRHRVPHRLFDSQEQFDELADIILETGDKEGAQKNNHGYVALSPEEVQKFAEILVFDNLETKEVNPSTFDFNDDENQLDDHSTSKDHSLAVLPNLAMQEGHQIPHIAFEDEEVDQPGDNTSSKDHSLAIIPNLAMQERHQILDIAYEEEPKNIVEQEKLVEEKIKSDPDPGPGIVDILQDMMLSENESNKILNEDDSHDFNAIKAYFEEINKSGPVSQNNEIATPLREQGPQPPAMSETPENPESPATPGTPGITTPGTPETPTTPEMPPATPEASTPAPETPAVQGSDANAENPAPAPITPTVTPAPEKVDEKKTNGENLQGQVEHKPDSQDTSKANMAYIPSMDHDVRGFYIDRHKVTNEEYMRFIKTTNYHTPLHWAGGHIPPGQEKQPVVNVSYVDALVYAVWNGKRLPTDEEWKEAAFKAHAFNDLQSPINEWTATTYIADRPLEQLNRQGSDNLMGQVLSNNYKLIEGRSDQSLQPMHSEESNAHTGFRTASD